MSAEHGHTHGTADGPPGGVGWIVLDAIVCATAVMLLGIFAQWLLAERRRAARALAEFGGPHGRPLVDMERLREYVESERAKRAPDDLAAAGEGQGHPDPGPATSVGD